MSTKIKQIPLTGLSTSPSDYDCEDGNLGIALNVLHENGAITNAANSAPKVVAGDLGDDQIIYQHTGSNYHHLIRLTHDDEQKPAYAWMDSDDERVSGLFDELSEMDVKHVVSVGNALIFYTEDNAYFYLWSLGDDGEQTYKSLGNNLPDFSMSFGLRSHTYRAREDMHGAEQWTSENYNTFGTYEENLTSFTTRKIDPYSKSIPDDCRQEFTNGSFADINYFQGKWCSEHGYFSQPFLVRYAIRLFDGSLAKHSAPILMVPATGVNPIVFVMAMDYDDDRSVFCIDTVGLACSLRYYISGALEDWEKWRDIVQGIEIFVSAPIYTYDASKQIETVEWMPRGSNYVPAKNQFFRTIRNNVSYCIPSDEQSVSKCDSQRTFLEQMAEDDRFNIEGTSASATTSQAAHPGIYPPLTPRFAAAYDDSQIFAHITWKYSTGETSADTISGYAPSCRIIIPERDTASIVKDIRNCSIFYHVLTLDIVDLLNGAIPSEEWIDAKIEDGVLGSLVNREVMSDDYDSHHTIIPNGAVPYNNRLNIYDIRKIYYDGFPATDSYQRIFDEERDGSVYFTDIWSFVYISTNAKQIITEQHTELDMSIHAPTDYFFYPDASAKKVVQFVRSASGGYAKRTFELREHEGMNGAVHFETLGDWSTKWSAATEEELADMQNLAGASGNDIEDHSILYTSQPANPFAFLAANVEQVGSGKIIALATAAKPLSTGQFGDFPMYAFTTEGIWALYPNESGGWRSKQPISYDVAVSPSSILQIDQSVLFVTDRGLMEISGSTVACISEVFDGFPDVFLYGFPTHLIDVLQRHTDIPASPIGLIGDFKAFLRGCNMHYDYPHQRIIIGNGDHPYCYVFNMKDRLWTAEMLRVTKAINSYPQAYAMASSPASDALINFSDDGDPAEIAMPTNGFILTRPFKLDAPDAMKTVRKVIARGHFSRQNVDIILYASRDLDGWLLIGSARGNELVNRHGSPYKYFRVGIITRLSPTESLSGLSVEYEIKQDNKLR